MPPHFSISIIIIVAAVVWGVSLIWFGVNLTWEYAKPFSVTVLAVSGLLTAFDRLLWRLWPFRIFHKTPDISGRWTAELLSSYAEQGSRENKAITGTATITQTYSSFSVRLVTGEEPNTNRSFTLAGRLIRHSDGAYEVIGVYQSDPNIHARGTETEIHFGAFRYRVIGTPPTEMNGHYWTDRSTKGSIQLRKCLRTQCRQHAFRESPWG